MKRFQFIAYDASGTLVDTSDADRSTDSLEEAAQTAYGYYRRQLGYSITIIDTKLNKQYSIDEQGTPLELD